MIFLKRYKKFTLYVEYNDNPQCCSVNDIRISSSIRVSSSRRYNEQLEYNYGQCSADQNIEIIATIWRDYISVSYYHKKILIGESKLDNYNTIRHLYRDIRKGRTYRTIIPNEPTFDISSIKDPLERLRYWHAQTRGFVSLFDKYRSTLVF